MSNVILPISYNEQGQAVVSTLDFAEGLQIQHKSLLETVRGYLSAIEKDFGRVTFETRPFETAGGTQYREIALLTEDQSLFVGSLSRNSERVVEFKSVLVRSFAEARKLLVGLPSYQIDDPIQRAKQWIREEEEKQALRFQLAELQPKAEYAEAVLISESTLTTTKIAQELGMTAQKLNQLLKSKGVQFKQSGMWNLTRKFNGKGYAKLSTFVHAARDGSQRTEHNLVWTEAGREFIHRLINPALSTDYSTSQVAIA